MGCVTSKVLTRSTSYQEELKQGLWASKKGFSISRKGDDHQFLALVCPADAVPKLLQRSANYDPESCKNDVKPPIMEHENMGTVDTLELKAGLDHQEEQEAVDRVESPITNARKRSNSFDSSSTRRELSVKENLQGSNQGMERCRSFHTVEEYEWLLKAKSLVITGLEVAENRNMAVEKANSEVTNSCRSNSITPEFKDESSRNVDVCKEKGSKRKTMAKELTSLKIPSTFELPTIASLKEWIQVDSPGAGATSKFGSFGSSDTMDRRKECSVDGSDSDSIFDPEMLSAIEDAMHLLQTEEQCVLQLIEDENTSR